ncbi:hypothetical protein VTP01DRAFT_10439 [Rhizomucor pusillus]|uniref:uncharacterized protein n=1 Tax=Rhizomucor pusillus TaxID=4840 RepID=UPI0037420EC5
MSDKPIKLAGELVVVALKARDLPNVEIVGKQDPFVIFRLGEEAKRTKTDYRGGQNPLWDDQVNIPVPEGKTKMYMQLFDEDKSREELICEGEIDLTNVLREGEEDRWFPLQYKGRSAGEIYLELTFYSARPPPKRQPTRYGGGKFSRPTAAAAAGAPIPPPKHNAYPHHQQYHHQYPSRPPPAPTESMSTPSRLSARVGPAPYVPPQRPHNEPQATPHMPPTLTPSSSTGTASSAGYPPAASQRPHGRPLSGGPYPQPSVSAGYRPSPNNNPMLSQPYRPNGGGYPAPLGFHIPPPPPQQQPYHPPAHSGAPPSQPGLSFPEPQTFTGEYTPHSDVSGQPFAAHQGSYPPPAPPGGYPHAAGGYPPHPMAGGYPPQPSYPPY